jgi:hypothetical protein
MRAIPTVCFLFIVTAMWAEMVSAQNFVRHQQPVAIERDSIVTLDFEVDQVSANQVLESLLFLRPSNRSNFTQIETRFESGRSRFELRFTDDNVTGVEYYHVLRLTDGREITYPQINNNETPVQVDVISTEGEALPVAGFIDYTILSPGPGRGTSGEDLLVAVALFYDDEDVEGGEFGIIFNGRDVSNQAEISPFTVKYKPEGLLSGRQNITVTFQRDNTLYEVVSWNFTVLTDESIAGAGFTPEGRSWIPTGNLELSARNQEVSGFNNDALTGRLRLTGRDGYFQYNIGSYLTSQDSGRLQPQNRYNLDVRYGEWARFQAGDFFPTMSDMTISGRRVRGINLGFNLFNNNFEAQFIRGHLNRRVSNLYETLQVDDVTIGDFVVDTLYTLQFEDGGAGTFRQNITGGRMAFGNRDKFQIAFQGAKIEDDTTSISVIRDYNDLMLIDQSLASGLENSHRQYLEQNPDQLQIAGANPRPRGNLAFSGELNMAFDDQRIMFTSETGMSLLNNDISGGPLNQQRAEELGVDLDRNIEHMFDLFSWLIIINEQMSTLPFKYVENETGDLEVDPFFPTSVLANDSRLHLNYLGHQVQASYQWIGPDYYSLANTTIRRDVAGFGITDRFRLLENRLNVTLGYENLRDNLMNSRDATMYTTTLRGGLSWYPFNQDLPRVSVATRYSKRDNDIERFNPFLPGQDADIRNAALRNFEVVDGDTVTTALPRLRETFSVNSSISQDFELFSYGHQVSLNYGITNTSDRVFTYGDSRNHSLSVRLQSTIDRTRMPFRTRIGYNINSSESMSGLSDVSIHGVDAGIEAFLFDSRLSLNTDFIYTRNRFSSLSLAVKDNNNPESFTDNYYVKADDSERMRRYTNSFIIRFGAQYDITRNHALMAMMNYTNNRDTLGNLASLTNDRILQLRYIFRF